MSDIHLYSAEAQPATRFRVDLSDRPHHVTFSPHRTLLTVCCRRRRQAKNLLVKAYYDTWHFYCRPGTGCRKDRT